MSTTEAPFSRKSIRVPPQDLGAEQALLGSIILKPGALNDLVSEIQPEIFYSERHRKIYRAMLKLFDKNEPIDLVSLTSSLTTSKQINGVGGASYLVELANSVPSAANLKYYSETVIKKARLRELMTRPISSPLLAMKRMKIWKPS